MSHLIGDLIGRLILASIGLWWVIYNANKLREWKAVPRDKAPVRYPVMMAYRIGCVAFGTGWAIYSLTANFA